MAKISIDTLREVKAALVRYENQVNATRMSDKSKHTYINHANHFVRWLDDDFNPGLNARRGAP